MIGNSPGVLEYTMLRRMSSTEASRVLDLLGLSLSEGYFWQSNLEAQAFNVMILTDSLSEEDGDPYASLEVLAQNHVNMAYRWNGRFQVRRGPTDSVRLVEFLKDILGSLLPLPCVMLRDNEGEHALCLEPWIEPFDRASLDHNPRTAGVFSALGVKEGEACAIACDLPTDIETIGLLAEWYLALASGRNLYILYGTQMKIVVCHECDVHFCSLRADLIEFIRERACALGLAVAPFSIQQCN